MITRRQFITSGGLSLVTVYISAKTGAVRRVFAQPIPGGTLDPTTVPKYAEPLIKPPAMPPVGTVGGVKQYEIGARQLLQNVLPASMGLPTAVWGYGAENEPDTYNFPGFTIEAEVDQTVRVKWVNGLVDGDGNFLPHLVPVDPTLHWANPGQLGGGIDLEPPDSAFAEGVDPYLGPVPITTHVHGAHVPSRSDGLPETWWLPDAADIPDGYVYHGTHYGTVAPAELGAAIFEYPNDQRATTMWYHDHVLGITRLNVYAGLAGFYLLRGGPDDLPAGELPGPAPGLDADPLGTYYEIPIVIQDRSFNDDGSLFYPDSRFFFDEFAGPYVPETDVPPIWNPEFFGNTMVVNGRTWPFLEVEQRRYRFRLLNGCNSRFLILDFRNIPGVEVWQIGAEGGFLAAPVNITAGHDNLLLMGPAERADVIVDFSGVAEGEYVLGNVGPDEPFGGGSPGEDFEPSDPATTGQVMQFRVIPATGTDESTPPAELALPAIEALGAADTVRLVSLNEISQQPPGASEEIPIEAELGSVVVTDEHTLIGIPLSWDHEVTENPGVGDTEIWEMVNFTADAHPIHLHLVQFLVVNREVLTSESPHYEETEGGHNIGTKLDPEPWEVGWKDTVIAYPGEITRIKARFDLPGRYVWHCHILEHEDNEMMRPYHVGPLGEGWKVYMPFIARGTENNGG